MEQWIGPVDVIIPTWNSMPELKQCLSGIKEGIPQKYIKQVIVVDKGSDDDTRRYAQSQGCIVVGDMGSLGSARLTGLRKASTKWILFIDSDIEVDQIWFNEMRSMYAYLVRRYDNVGWFFGRTIDDVEPMHSEKLFKMHREFPCTFSYRIVSGRAYTHNTFALREPLLHAPIEDVNAWEDFLLAKEMRNAGYRVVEVNTQVMQHRRDTYLKNGIYTEAWSQQGMIQVYGIRLVTVFRPLWFIYWGVVCLVHFRKWNHFVYNLRVCWSIVMGCIQKKQFVRKVLSK